MSLATHLAPLSTAELTAVLERRADVLVEPAPRSLQELADRLNAVDSLRRALVEMDADELAVARNLALTDGRSAAGSGPAADAVVARLAGRALVWPDGARLALPPVLADRLGDGVTRFRRFEAIAREATVASMRTAVAALGGDPAGPKAPLTARLTGLIGDPATVRRAVDRLSPSGRQHLDRVLNETYLFGATGAAQSVLVAAGLMLHGRYRQAELPREVAVAMVLGSGPVLAGRPVVARSTAPADDGRAAAEASVHALTGLLDAAAEAPLPSLKKGGVGVRERARLAKRLGIEEPALIIDVAAATALLASTRGGYAPSADFDAWRERPVAQRWAAAVQGWLGIEWSPTYRDTDDGEVAPPVPLTSSAGMLRTALLRAAAGGGSLESAAAGIGWFCPLHHYDEIGLARTLAAIRHEGALLGVVTGDRLTELGERLIAGQDVADLLPDSAGTLVLQSDLTAVAAGATSAAAARVLAAAAIPESHGAAVTWRFSPGSVRAALDVGWTVQALRAELIAVSGRGLPQPLDYLLRDVARRHGAIRLREVRCVITGSEADMGEILHTRSLAKLALRRIAPTVLAAAATPDVLLSALRKAGFAPVAEDADGQVVVAAAEKPQRRPSRRPEVRRRLSAAEVADALSSGGSARDAWPTRDRLADLNPRLDAAELTLLADAVDHERAVHIRYRNTAGNISTRDVTPLELWDRWVTAHCHLREDEREFAVARIETVAPAG